jgi:hypothetical protein
MVDRIEGLDSSTDDCRPYCAVTVSGSDAKGRHTEYTESRKSKRGTAKWSSKTANSSSKKKSSSSDAEQGDQSAGVKLEFHATGFHDELLIEVCDSSQFMDKHLGTAFLQFGSPENPDHLRGAVGKPLQQCFELWILQPEDGSDADGDGRKWPDGTVVHDPDRWSRFARTENEEDDEEEQGATLGTAPKSVEADAMDDGMTPRSKMDEAQSKA